MGEIVDEQPDNCLSDQWRHCPHSFTSLTRNGAICAYDGYCAYQAPEVRKDKHMDKTEKIAEMIKTWINASDCNAGTPDYNSIATKIKSLLVGKLESQKKPFLPDIETNAVLNISIITFNHGIDTSINAINES